MKKLIKRLNQGSIAERADALNCLAIKRQDMFEKHMDRAELLDDAALAIKSMLCDVANCKKAAE